MEEGNYSLLIININQCFNLICNHHILIKWYKQRIETISVRFFPSGNVASVPWRTAKK